MNDLRMRIAGALAGSLLSAAGCGGSAEAPEEDDIPAEVQSLHDEGLRGNALTREQAQIVLKLVDDICGDTWCEGDYNFRFHRIVCDAGDGSCALTLQRLAYEGGPTPPLPRWHVCRTSGFTGFESLVETSASGYQSLHRDYYDSLNTCISEFESR